VPSVDQPRSDVPEDVRDPRGHDWVIDEEDKGHYIDSYDTFICANCGCRSVKDRKNTPPVKYEYFAGNNNDLTCDEVVVKKIHES
jgi:hypothetical protein